LADHQAGVIIQDGAEDGFGGAVAGADLRAMEEVADPQVIDVVHFVGFAHIGALFGREPPLAFDHPEQGVIVDGRLTQDSLISELFVESLYREVGIGLAFDLDDLEGLFVQASGPAPIGTALGLEGFKPLLAVLPKPGLQGGNPELPAAIVGKVMLGLGLLAEVLILGPFRLSQDRADDLKAFEGDFFADVFFHGFYLLGKFLG
jgi:hypothetical protein